MYDEIIQAVIGMAETAAGVPVLLGSMPPDNGIAMIGSGGSSPIFLDMGSCEDLTLVCNGKNGDQETVVRQLDAIHRSLTRRFDFPHSDAWQIYAIETIASPRLIGREENERAQWVYGSSLRVKIYVKGVCTR